MYYLHYLYTLKTPVQLLKNLLFTSLKYYLNVNLLQFCFKIFSLNAFLACREISSRTVLAVKNFFLRLMETCDEYNVHTGQLKVLAFQFYILSYLLSVMHIFSSYFTYLNSVSKQLSRQFYLAQRKISKLLHVIFSPYLNSN